MLIETALSAGDGAVARDLAQELRKLQPDFTLDQWAARQPFRDAAIPPRIVARPREAGLP